MPAARALRSGPLWPRWRCSKTKSRLSTPPPTGHTERTRDLEPWPRQLDRKLDSYSTGSSTGSSTATRQNTPDSMRRRRQVSSSTARQTSTDLDRPRQTSSELDRPRQTSTDLDRAEPIRTSLLEPHSFKVKVDGDPLVNYTTWWLDDGFTSGGPFVPRSVCLFVLFLT